MTVPISNPRRWLTAGRAVLAVAIAALASSLFLVFGVAHSRTAPSLPATAAAGAEPAPLWPELWHGFEVNHLRLH